MSGWPAGYPSRGTWAFYNVTRSFAFWPKLSSISINQLHPDGITTFDCEVEDRNASITFGQEDEVYVTFDGTRIWGGHVRTLGWRQESEFGPRTYRLTGQDFTAKLDDSVILTDSKRPRQALSGRVNWILDRLNWSLTTDGVNLPDETVEPAIYEGMTVREALEQVSDEKALSFYVDFDNDLHIFRNETLSTPFDLDDTSPDYSTSFPYSEFAFDTDSVELTNAVRVHGLKHKRWVEDAASIATYGRHESILIDDSLETLAQVVAAGQRRLNQLDIPIPDGSLVCWEPGLRAGMKLDISNDLWSLDAEFIITEVRITAEDPHDADSTALLRSEISFSDKRRVGRFPGTRSRKMHNKRQRKKQRQVDPASYPLDGFDRTTGSEDASDGAAFTWVEDLGYRELLDYDGTLDTYYQYVGDTKTAELGSTSGVVAYPWTARPAWSACTGLGFTYAHAAHQALWSKFTVGTHATSAAGVKVTLSIETFETWSVGKLVAIYAKSSAPTYADRGSYVTSLVLGSVGSHSYTFTVPQAAIPAATGTMWVGLEPEDKATEGTYTCGYLWPYQTGAEGSWKSEPASGTTWTMTWQTAGDAGWGAIPEGQGEDTEAPWDGGNTWAVSGTNVTFAVDGTAGTMTANADDVTGTARLAAEDDETAVTDPWGPWSGGRGLFKVLFTVDPIGDTADAAQNTVTISVAGDGWRGAVIVHLGDNVAWSYMDPDQQRGLVVKQGDSSPTYSDFVAKTLASGLPYYVLFDTRGETIKAKLWAAAATEPNDWDIEVARSYEAVTGNWFDIIFDANSGMMLSVESIEAAMGLPPGSALGRHVVGYGDGSTVTYSTLSPFAAGTLSVWVDGFPVAPLSYDASAGTFTLSRAPYGDPSDETGSAVVEAQYEAA